MTNRQPAFLPFRFRPAEQVEAARYFAKWMAVLTPVAVVTGAISALFLWSLEEVTKLRFDHGWLLWLLPVAGVAVAGTYHLFGREVEAGNNLVVDRIHEPGAGIPARIVPLIFVGTVVSHLFGASVGREGTAVQMGGGVASAFNRVFRFGEGDMRTLLMAGVAAGFGAVFGTPLAGAVFAMEVIAIGRMDYGALIPVLFAALLADYTCGALGAEHTEYLVSVPAVSGHLPFDGWLMVKVVFGGAAFGVVAVLFAELTHGLGGLFRRAIPVPYLRPAVGAVIVIGLVLVLGTREYLGLGVLAEHPGDVTIVSSFGDGGAAPFSWWWKIAFTAIAIGAGFKGGEVTPLFFIGASLGNRLAKLLSAPVDVFAGVGFVAVFAAAANAPLACTVMGIELFGAGVAPYLAVGCFVAYLVSGHSGIYLSQRVGTPKAGRPADGAMRTLRANRDDVGGR